MANKLRILKPEELEASQKERIIIYGRAGIGKTRFALSLPERWGKIAYFAADMNSEFLASIDKSKRDRVIVVKPEGDDPTALFMQFCRQDWKEVDPEIGTLVVDTFTKVAYDGIRFSANTLAMTKIPHEIVGNPQEGGQVIPNWGDFQAVEALSRGYLEELRMNQSDMNIIFLCHEDVKSVENVAAVGGPAHPGRQMTEYLPAQFNTVIRLIRDHVLIPGEDEPRNVVLAITENDGKFIAKVRTSDEEGDNPLARFELDRDPTNFWVKYDEIYYKGDAPAKPIKKRGK